MSLERCPKCNREVLPQQSVCNNCGAKLTDDSIKKINSIYKSSNISTLVYLGILFIGAMIYGFFNWILAVIVVVVLFAVALYFKFR